MFPKPLSDAEYRKIVMDYIKGIFPDAKEDEVDFRDTMAIIAAKRMEVDCMCCVNIKECPHSTAILKVYPVIDRNNRRQFKVGAVICDKVAGISEKKRITDLYEESRIPRRRRAETFEKFETLQGPIALMAAKNMAQECAKSGDGLIIGGPVGAGKTHLAIAMAVERMEKGNSVLFYSMPELMDLLRNFTNEQNKETLENAKKVDLLILDDAGVERVSDWTDEKLYMLIDHRYNENLQTVITTNAMSMSNLKELLTAKGNEDYISRAERICSRLGEMTRQIWLKDVPDYRKKLKKEK